MANVIKDFVVEESTTTGTGSITVSGAINNMRTFSSVCSTGDDVRFIIKGVDSFGVPTGEWEVVQGKYSAANTLTRVTVIASSNADSLVSFSAGTKQVYLGSDATMLSWVREKLTAARTYYVRTDGSDSNTGLANTSGGAFLTIQKAIDVICSTLDISAGVTVTVQVADGTYTGANVMKQYVGAGSVTIQGNSGTPANVVISVTSNHCFYNAIGGTTLTVKDLKVTTTTGGSGLVAYYGGVISLSNIDFGACVAQHKYAVGGGAVLAAGNYTISGSAASHENASSSGTVDTTSRTVTLTGTPAFSSGYAVSATSGTITNYSCTFSGSATGVRYAVSLNGAINTLGSGATYFPGNSAGTTATGGQYV